MGNFGRPFLILLLLLGTVVVGFFYLRPAWQEFQQNQEKLSRLESLSAELDDLIANKDAIFEKIASISEADLKRMNAVVPKGPKAADFLVSLEAIAVKNGVTLKNVSLRTKITIEGVAAEPTGPRPAGRTFIAPAQKQGLNELTYDFTITATYENIKAFLKDLEKNRRIADVKVMSFNSGTSKSAADELNVDVTVVAYYQ